MSRKFQIFLDILSMEIEDKNLLIEGCRRLGIHLGEDALKAFELYLKELLKWNRKINLTAIRTEKGIVLKHFIDSLSLLPCLPKAAALLDIGSGAGFPGIPLKIVRPSLEITLIDSVLKKVDFERHIIRSLRLKGIEAIHGRVQDRRILQAMGGRFDIIISRAFSDLHTFLTLSVSFLKPGGMVVAMKGKVEDEEIQRLAEVEKDRFHLERMSRFVLPSSTLQRSLLFFKLSQAGTGHPLEDLQGDPALGETTCH